MQAVSILDCEIHLIVPHEGLCTGRLRDGLDEIGQQLSLCLAADLTGTHHAARDGKCFPGEQAGQQRMALIRDDKTVHNRLHLQWW